MPVSRLETEWVPGAHAVYIGKADDAHTRLKTYGRFGQGEPIAHWGGRLIWQLPEAQELLVAWHIITWGEDPREYERRLIKHFAASYGGKRPFANLRW